MKYAPFLALPVFLASMLSEDLAAQAGGAIDPTGKYLLNVNAVGDNCPKLYPRAELILTRRSGNEFTLQMGGAPETVFFMPERLALQGVITEFGGAGPVALSGTVDNYRGQKTLDLNLRWTGRDCTASANGGLENPAPSEPSAASPAAAPEPASTVAAPPPPTVIGPANTATTLSSPAPTRPRAPSMPFLLKLLLGGAIAIILGNRIGKWLARRVG